MGVNMVNSVSGNHSIVKDFIDVSKDMISLSKTGLKIGAKISGFYASAFEKGISLGEKGFSLADHGYSFARKNGILKSLGEISGISNMLRLEIVKGGAKLGATAIAAANLSSISSALQYAYDSFDPGTVLATSATGLALYVGAKGLAKASESTTVTGKIVYGSLAILGFAATAQASEISNAWS